MKLFLTDFEYEELSEVLAWPDFPESDTVAILRTIVHRIDVATRSVPLTGWEIEQCQLAGDRVPTDAAPQKLCRMLYAASQRSDT